LQYALIFLIWGLVAGALGLSGIASIAGQIAWVLFIIGIILLVKNEELLLRNKFAALKAKSFSDPVG
jgi:uncharacterized membrane protein YtjA (UPF0391 family)